MSSWCTIESDPGVFTELIEKFGVKDLQVEELWNLEDDTFARLRGNVYGLIFLFKYDKDKQTSVGEATLERVPDGLFFAKQMIPNACATQAILNILLNCQDRVELGSTLTDFRSFTGMLDPESAGMAIDQCDPIRVAHNSFARPEPIHVEHDRDDKDDDAFHFVSYVPSTGTVYELDGLQRGPRIIGDAADGSDWWTVARPAIQQRMADYAGGELRFTLLAVTRNLAQVYTDELNALPGTATADARTELISLIESEKAKHEAWRKANIRRRHNYFPFIFSMLKVLAENNVLKEMTDRATEKKAVKIAARKEAEKTAAEKEKTDVDVEMADAPKTEEAK